MTYKAATNPQSGARWNRLHAHARAAIIATQAAAMRSYDRQRILPRLIHADIAVPGLAVPGLAEPEQTRAAIAALSRALRAERARQGHWTYDLNRHIALNQALQAERARLATNENTPPHV